VNAQAAAAHDPVPRSFARRVIAPALVALSMLLAMHDLAHVRADLLIEGIARIGMAAVAAIMLYGWPADARYEQQRALLLWGVIGFSFDLFWQVAYGGIFQAIAMVLKYAGIAAGLACFIALTASFGNGERDELLRRFIVAAAAPFGILLFALGTWHGYLWLRHCGGTAGPCIVNDAYSLPVFRTYFALDAVGRLAVFAAAILALASSSKNRQRLLLVALSAAVLSLGTAVDFLARLRPLAPETVFALQVFDAACTLAFVAGLFIAITKKRMFDVAFAFSAGVINVLVFLVWLALIQLVEPLVGTFPVVVATLLWFVVAYVQWLCPNGVTRIALRQALVYVSAMALCYGAFIFAEALLHGRAHEAVGQYLERSLPWGHAAFLGDLGLAAIGAFTLTRFEEWAKEWIASRLLPPDDKPLALLRHFRKGIPFFTEAAELERMLVHVVTTNLKAEFAHIFLHHDAGHYEVAASYPDSAPKPPEVPLDCLPEDVRCGKCRRDELPQECVPAARLVPVMYAPKPGRLFGFLALGQKRSEDGEDFTQCERKELRELGKEAGGALYELRGHA